MENTEKFTENALIPLDPAIKARIIEGLAQDIPVTRAGIPEYIFRPDMIPANLYDLPQDEQQQILSAASVRISYHEGFPAMPNGEPIWHQFSFEDVVAYNLFSAYLELIEDDSTPIRTLSILSTKEKHSLKDLQDYFHQYWWQIRARAHDLFIYAARRRLKQRRQFETADKHHLIATQFIESCAAYLIKAFENPEAHNLKASDVISLLQKMMVAQRVSNDMPANGPTGAAAGDPNEVGKSLTVVLNDLAGDSGIDISEETENIAMSKLLENEEALAQAQKLIINYGRGKKGDKASTYGGFLEDSGL